MPEHVASGLLRAVSSSLGGDLLLWSTVQPGDVVTIISVVDPVPAAQVAADRIPRDPVRAPTSLLAEIARRQEAVLIPALDLEEHSVDTLPDPWPAYLREHPVYGFIAVPETTTDGVTTVLIAGRRRRFAPYDDDDLATVRDAARRLAGERSSDHLDDAVDVVADVDIDVARQRRRERTRHWLAAVSVGLALPLVALALLLPADDPNRYLPGAIFLLCCVAAAFVAGTAGAVLAGVASSVAIWWGLTRPRYSFRVRAGADVLGLVLFALSAAGVVLVMRRLEIARSLERSERRLSDTLLDQSPVAMAVFDRELRFRRVNQPMAVMNERSATEHIGLRPSDISPVVGQLYEPLLARVRDTGEVIVDHAISMSMPEVGIIRHWRVNAQPVRDVAGMLVGVSAAVADVTDDVVVRERAEWLLRLSQALSNAITGEEVATRVCRHLVELFRGRAAYVEREGDALVVVALAGFGDDDAELWRSRPMPLDELTPLTDSLARRRPLVMSSPAAFAERYPDLAHERAQVWDASTLAAGFGPDRAAGRCDGVLYIGWGGARAVTERSVTLIDTVASLVALARARIGATDALHQIEFRGALDAMIDRVEIGHAVRSSGGDIVDFEIEFANSAEVGTAGRSAAEIIGRRQSDLHPRWRTSGLFERFCEVVETGEPFQAERIRYSDIGPDGSPTEGFWSLQVAKLGDGYIAASRDMTAVVEAEVGARAAERQREAERTSIELLQSAALPATLPDLPGLSLGAAYVPCDEEQPIGGDWYDAFALDSNRLALVIADVAGHGQPAAAFMLQVRNVFRAIAVEHAEPGEVMFRANEVTVRLNDPDGPFVTCCYAVLHLPTRRLHWAQAGHFSPMLLRADGTAELLPERPGVPLAMFPRQRFDTSVVQLEPGDRIVMFTDGLVERRDEVIDIGVERLRVDLEAHAALSPQALLEAVTADVKDRFDDLAALCLALEADP